MTTGAVSATILRDCLKRHGVSPDLPPNFFKALAKFASGPWGMATGADFAVPGTEGKRPLMSRLLGPLMNRLFVAGNEDQVVRDRIGEVINLIEPPSALFELPILGRAAIATVRRAFKPKSRPEAIPALPPAAPEVARS
jgi:hypothetical protein